MMRSITKGSTDQSVVIRIVDAADGTPEQAVEHNTSGIALWYRREGGTKATITPAALSALNDAHSDGGIEHIDDGYYRLDVPDAAFASGADGVMIGGAITDMVVIGCYVPLIAVNQQDAVRGGMTALPNAAADAAGGLPISDAGGLDMDALPTAAENADALLGRNVAGGSSSGRTVKEALYFLRNKWTVESGTLTVFGTDDTTSAWTASVTQTAGNPVSASDPA